MELASVISNLLRLYDCVIIPDFGGFIGNYHPAEINETTHTLRPPRKDLIFNRNLSYNDGLLINYLAVSQNVSYEEARLKVLEETMQIRSRLEGGEKISIDGIGFFKHNKEGQLEFHPEITTNFLLDSYGLSTFQIPTLEPYRPAKEFEKTLKNHDSMSSLSTRKIVTGVLVGVPIIAALIFIPLKTDWLNKKEMNYSSLNPVVAETLLIQKSDSSKAVELEKVIDQQTEKRTALLYQETPTPANISQHVYYLISGSFKNILNAERQKADLLTKGYEAKILTEKENLFRVAILQTNSRREALQQLEKLRADLGNNSIWLLTR